MGAMSFSMSAGPQVFAAAMERLALSLARDGLGQTWPNPSVGAVIVTPDGRIVGRGVTAKGGRPHAETLAIVEAGESARGAAMYVTLEPCVHHGLTPPCTDAILRAGLREVVYGLADPDPRVSGQGLNRLEREGVRVRRGAFTREAAWITLGHTLRVKERRPFIQVKLAVGSDGLVPAGNGAPVWVTCEESRAFAHLLRAQTDAIAVGGGTIAADNPQLTCRLPGLFHRSPIRVVFSARAAVQPDARLFDDIDTTPVWIVTSEAVARTAQPLRDKGAKIIACELDAGRVAIKPALRALAEQGITRLFVEGGPALAGAFLDSGLIDEIFMFRAAKAAGVGGLPPFGDAGLEKLIGDPSWNRVDARPIACDVVETYRRVDWAN
jgi:diaminohydroxyphosphoribosylaminopyrimidine deaminase/5-amino-6-(5-phosphoribosylamino)uracil reductase